MESITVTYWYYFWVANLLLAGSAFTLIVCVVCVLGFKDLIEMFAKLRGNTR